MSTLREAAQQSLEALESLFNWQVDPDRGKRCSDAITALRAALAQQDEPKGGGNLPPPLQAEPVQEPVAPYAWMAVGGTIWRRKTSEDDVPLYTHPPRREWQRLTNEEMYGLYRRAGLEAYYPRDGVVQGDYDMRIDAYARAVEAKIKEKNNG